MNSYDEGAGSIRFDYAIVGARIAGPSRVPRLTAVTDEAVTTFPVTVTSNTDLVQVTAVQVGTAQDGVCTSINVTLEPNPEHYGGRAWHRTWNVDVTACTRSRNYPDDLGGRRASDGGIYHSLEEVVSGIFDIVSEASPHASYDEISSMHLAVTLEPTS